MHVDRGDDVITVRCNHWQLLGPFMMITLGAVLITFLPGDTIQGAELLTLRALGLLIFLTCLLRPRSYCFSFDFNRRHYERTELRFWRRTIAHQAGELSGSHSISVTKSTSFPTAYELTLTGGRHPVRLCVMYRSESFDPEELDQLAQELNQHLFRLDIDNHSHA